MLSPNPNSTPLPAGEGVPFKVTLDSFGASTELRRGRYVPGSGFDALKTQLTNLFGLAADQEVLLSYADPDGDMVRFSTQAELDEALALTPTLLRLHVAKPTSPAAAAADEQQQQQQQQTAGGWRPGPWGGRGFGFGRGRHGPGPAHHGPPHPGPMMGPAHHGPPPHGPPHHGPPHHGCAPPVGKLLARREALQTHSAAKVAELEGQLAALDASIAEASTAVVDTAADDTGAAKAEGDCKQVGRAVNRWVHLSSKKALVTARLASQDLSDEKRAKLTAKLAKVEAKIGAAPPSRVVVQRLELRRAKLQQQLDKAKDNFQTRFARLDQRIQATQERARGKMADRWHRTLGPAGPFAGLGSIPNPFGAPGAPSGPAADKTESSSDDDINPPPYTPSFLAEDEEEDTAALLGGKGCGKESKAKARFVRDVTVADGTVFEAGQTFVKTWRLRNAGDAEWPAGTALVLVGKASDPMGADAVQPLPASVAPGAEADVSVAMTAPAEAGRYVAFWRLQDPTGRKFGQRVWVEVQVAPASSSDSLEDDDVCVVTAADDAEPDEMALALASLQAMGFVDERRNRKVLRRCNGNVPAAVEALVLRSMPVHHAPPRGGNAV